MKSKFKTIVKNKGLLHVILSIIVILVMLRHIMKADYHSVFLCGLTLLLFDIPLIVNKKFGISLSKELEAIINVREDSVCIYQMESLKFTRKEQIGTVESFSNII